MSLNISNTHISFVLNVIALRLYHPFIGKRHKQNVVGLGTHIVLNAEEPLARSMVYQIEQKEMRGCVGGEPKIHWPQKNMTGGEDSEEIMVLLNMTLKICESNKIMCVLFATKQLKDYLLITLINLGRLGDCYVQPVILFLVGMKIRQILYWNFRNISTAMNNQPCHRNVLLEIANNQ